LGREGLESKVKAAFRLLGVRGGSEKRSVEEEVAPLGLVRVYLSGEAFPVGQNPGHSLQNMALRWLALGEPERELPSRSALRGGRPRG
jgi:hypothetical protein